MASGHGHRCVKYWDLEGNHMITQTTIPSSVPYKLEFFDLDNDDPVEWILAGCHGSPPSIRCVNVEQNCSGEVLSVPDHNAQNGDFVIDYKYGRLLNLCLNGDRMSLYQAPIPEMKVD